jgi:diaminopimelate decarboxylase
MQCWGLGRVAFSVKTNPLFALLQDLKQWGAFAEVVSAWEFAHAIAAGFPSDQIVFNGPLKTEKDLQRVFQTPPLTVNIDSPDELETVERAIGHWGGRADVGLRLCPPRQNGGTWSRFGIGSALRLFQRRRPFPRRRLGKAFFLHSRSTNSQDAKPRPPKPRHG